eukprot:CAMPEP_0119126028 /NCGR_PEP_ID=MMETSP1310-20130426/5100_1 /TAXON_ID=464262 /ORGANISM="Genus nov. species nov., Strain RCC2339" /LENGTH=179 /DNA_ID=CAMNT_0007116151 /DNA_START=190 /DNA_END=726 /DNA_ORIENTATION=-
MTAITGIWEGAFLYNYEQVAADAADFIAVKKHVWTTSYDLSYILPWKFSPIMYTEYAAHGDRSYMSLTDPLSQIVETTHLLYCSVFAALCLYLKAKGDTPRYLIFMSLAMASQSMQCLTYMSNYFIETGEPHHANFICDAFPAGPYFEKRPFMYVNLFWTFMGLFVIGEQTLSFTQMET